MICRFCREEIKEEAVKCKHCGEFLTKEAARQQITGRNNHSIIHKIADYQKLSGIFWIGLGIVQCITVVAVIAGVWNIMAGFSRCKFTGKVLARDYAVVKEYESLTGIVLIALVNLVLGGVIGIIFAGFDYYIRGIILENRHLFNVGEAAPAI